MGIFSLYICTTRLLSKQFSSTGYNHSFRLAVRNSEIISPTDMPNCPWSSNKSRHNSDMVPLVSLTNACQSVSTVRYKYLKSWCYGRCTSFCPGF